MNPEHRPPRRGWLLGALALLVLAIAAALALFGTLMAPDPRELRDFAFYLALTGGAVMGMSWLMIEALDRVPAPSLRVRAALGAVVVSLASLLSILVLARLMFVSTTHDLPVLAAVLAFAGIVAAFVSYQHAGRISTRIEAAIGQVEQLAEGAYQPRVGEHRDAVLDRLDGQLERLAAQLAAVEVERGRLDAERREMFASISHDLRTPLASVRASAEALADGLVPPDETARYFDRIERDIARLDGMIEDLFELAQLGAGYSRLECEQLPLVEIASDVVDAMQPLAAVAGIALQLRVDRDPGTLPLDGLRVQRAIANLLRNALEHTERGDTVCVSLGIDGRSAVLAVADTGGGIERTDLERIWEREPQSIGGLGLAIVRGVATAHGGAVDADSAPGRGATFTIRLPLDSRALPDATSTINRIGAD